MSKRFDSNSLGKVVLKIGSSSIVNPDGEVRLGFLGKLVTTIGRLHRRGVGVVLVTSGSIAMGFTHLKLERRPMDIPTRQACAAAGQTELMKLYQTLFETNGLRAGQVLLTREDIENRRRYLNAREALNRLMSLGVIPIVNENDSVAVEEIQYGDNDQLSAYVSGLVDADLLVLLTDVDGVLGSDSKAENGRRLIGLIEGPVNQVELAICDRPRQLGSGGITSKLEAAEICSQYGIPSVIARSSGRVLREVLEGEPVGTYILPQQHKTDSRRRWLSAAAVAGTLVLDSGAAEAICNHGKSLLPKGVLALEGEFLRGAVLKLTAEDGKELGKGIVHYNSTDMGRIKGCHGKKIQSILGYTFGDEVIHRDDLVLSGNGGNHEKH